MGQTWEDLLFAHWVVPAPALRSLVPDGLELDTFGGRAYLGVTPFRVSGLRLRGTVPLPLVSSFLELNVRTYVTHGGRPGIWFFSLDAASRLAVEAARRMYKLPYFHAAVSAVDRGGWIDYSCVRGDRASRPVVFNGRFRPVGPPATARPGSLEHFLVERYCLYAVDEGGALHQAEIHHGPWPLQAAAAEVDLNTMAPDPIALPDEAPLLHFSRRQDVVLWPLKPVA
ncbi:MAG: YqjF family protein [Gaiellaceae bacterium]